MQRAIPDRVIDEQLSGVVNRAWRRDAAIPLVRDGLKIFRDLGDRQYVARCLDIIGTVFLAQHDYVKATEFFQIGSASLCSSSALA